MPAVVVCAAAGAAAAPTASANVPASAARREGLDFIGLSKVAEGGSIRCFGTVRLQRDWQRCRLPPLTSPSEECAQELTFFLRAYRPDL